MRAPGWVPGVHLDRACGPSSVSTVAAGACRARPARSKRASGARGRRPAAGLRVRLDAHRHEEVAGGAAAGGGRATSASRSRWASSMPAGTSTSMDQRTVDPAVAAAGLARVVDRGPETRALRARAGGHDLAEQRTANLADAPVPSQFAHSEWGACRACRPSRRRCRTRPACASRRCGARRSQPLRG